MRSEGLHVPYPHFHIHLSLAPDRAQPYWGNFIFLVTK